jgi:DNA-binding NarL/FixJ family response regulator
MSYFKLGLSLNKIAKNLKKTRRSIDGRLVKICAERKHKHYWTLEEVEEMKSLLKQGLTALEISEKMKLSFECIKGAIDRYINKPKRKARVKEMT